MRPPPPLPTWGIIVQYHSTKGSGYVRAPATREEFYFKTELHRRDLALGTTVAFVVKWDGREYMADELVPIRAQDDMRRV